MAINRKKQILVGFKKFHSNKSNKDFCVANVLKEYTEFEKKSGNYGSHVEEIFLPDDMINYLQADDIGKEVNTNYEYSGGRAYLLGFEVIRN